MAYNIEKKCPECNVERQRCDILKFKWPGGKGQLIKGEQGMNRINSWKGDCSEFPRNDGWTTQFQKT